jgi:excisionase family DNA binding protein
MHRPEGALRLDACPDVFDFETLQQLVPIGTTTLRDLTRRGVIPSIRAGRRVLYSRDAISRWLAGEPRPSEAPMPISAVPQRHVAR